MEGEGDQYSSGAWSWFFYDLHDRRDHYNCRKNKLQEKLSEAKEDHIWLCEGQPHVGDHTIEDDKGVF